MLQESTAVPVTSEDGVQLVDNDAVYVAIDPNQPDVQQLLGQIQAITASQVQQAEGNEQQSVQESWWLVWIIHKRRSGASQVMLVSSLNAVPRTEREKETRNFTIFHSFDLLSWHGLLWAKLVDAREFKPDCIVKIIYYTVKRLWVVLQLSQEKVNSSK